MVLDDVVQTSQAVAATRSRTAKVDLLAQLLARTSREEVVATTSFLSGSLPRGRVGVGYRSLRELPEPATEPTITVAEVDRWLAELAALEGSGSTAKRRDALRSLLARATADEQRYLTALLVGELRQGALDGVMLPAVAKAAGVDLDLVRRAAMLSGSTPTVAQAALLGGAEALEAIELEVLRPVQPMLAVSSPTVAEALTELVGAQGDPKDASDLPDRVEVAVECKIDGIRVQVHRDGDEVVVVTRSLDDITSRLPEIVDLARALPVDRVVLDGEAVALRPGGRPQPFQVTGARTGSRGDAAVLRERTPLTVYLFDVLHLDGRTLLDEPLAVRRAELQRIAPDAVIPSITTASAQEAQEFFDGVVADGHEGVVVKALDRPYAAGRRGAGWIKVKPRHTFDLVVLAVEHGSGRRRGTLSNIHLGARDPRTGELVMVGKTFKGMTDEMLAWQTKRFTELETARDDWTVQVRPEQVVEIAIDGVQTSSRYPGGIALRFARVLRYRDDKTAAEADTLDDLRRLHGDPADEGTGAGAAEEANPAAP
ncbi:ATP-dependent DNA ligase [Arsenicicoccus piscis]|uniref:ATP-dependent DNA ligase n=1 Tax=Arsenicicoccus piscis TaxID=673954 RepID=UPI001F4C92C0|nr:ATP-dependent DNA ligase [Arsenicicoccus piscis]MCH8627147.1 ATP-dependent DNA ligase [Arsenicicoccus piscis]